MRQSNCILTACVFCAYRNSQIPEPITTRIVYISTIITSCPTVVLQYARGKRSDAITVSSIFSFREILSPKNVLFNRGLNNSIVKLGFLWKKSAKSAKRGHWPRKPWLHITQTIDAYGLTTHRVVSGFAIIEHRLVMFWVWKQAFYTVAIWSGVERTEHLSFHSNRLRTAILIIRIEWNCCCVENSSSVRVDITYVRCIDHELECRLAHIACNFNLHRDGCSTKRLKKNAGLLLVSGQTHALALPQPLSNDACAQCRRGSLCVVLPMTTSHQSFVGESVISTDLCSSSRSVFICVFVVRVANAYRTQQSRELPVRISHTHTHVPLQIINNKYNGEFER